MILTSLDVYFLDNLNEIISSNAPVVSGTTNTYNYNTSTKVIGINSLFYDGSGYNCVKNPYLAVKFFNDTMISGTLIIEILSYPSK